MRVFFPIFPLFKCSQLAPQNLREYLGFLWDRGARNFITTPDHSLYSLLSRGEIITMNSQIHHFLKNKDEDFRFIAGLPIGPTDFANTFFEIDEDVRCSILITFPDIYYVPSQIHNFYTDMTEVYRQIVINATSLNGPNDWWPTLIEELCENTRIMGTRNHLTNLETAKDICGLTMEDFPVITDSQEQYRFLQPYGASDFIARVGSINPEIDLSLNFEAERKVSNLTKNMGWAPFRTGLVKEYIGIDTEIRRPFPEKISETVLRLLIKELKKHE